MKRLICIGLLICMAILLFPYHTARAELLPSQSEVTLGVGDRIALQALSDGAPVAATYRSTNKRIAAVNENGVVRALRKGIAKIFITTGYGETCCQVSVVPAPKKISASVKSHKMVVGERYTVQGKVSGGPSAVRYKSSNSRVASVDQNGEITANRPGSAVITLSTYNGKKARVSIRVYRAPDRIALSSSKLSLKPGKSATLKVRFPKNTWSRIAWESSNALVAQVKSGKVQALKPGVAVITARTENGVEARCTVSVGRNGFDLAPLMGQNLDVVRAALPELTHTAVYYGYRSYTNRVFTLSTPTNDPTSAIVQIHLHQTDPAYHILGVRPGMSLAEVTRTLAVYGCRTDAALMEDHGSARLHFLEFDRLEGRMMLSFDDAGKITDMVYFTSMVFI